MNFDLCKCSIHFYRIDDQINTVYEKYIYFDMQKCEFSLKHSNSNCWLCFETGVIEV